MRKSKDGPETEFRREDGIFLTIMLLRKSSVFQHPIMKMCRSLCLLAVLLAAFAPGPISHAREFPAVKQRGSLLWEEFQTDPLQHNWRQAALPRQKFAGEWHAASGQEPNFIAVKDGYWESPMVPVRPLAYYRVRFQSRSEKNGYCWAQFYDAEGKEIIPDNHENFWASSDWSEQEFFFRAHALATQVRLRFKADQSPIAVARVALHASDEGEVRAWQKRIWEAMPKLNYSPPPNRGELLPKTALRLKNGGVLRIVMLGDSICNDTSNSLFETQLRKLYPRTHFEVTLSVRGGTGCSWYQMDNRVQEYVLRFHPDLLIIAGISHGYDSEAMRSVILQVRSRLQPDILIVNDSITPQAHLESDYIKYSGLSETVAKSNIRLFPQRLTGVARAENVEFLDMRTAWNTYLNHSSRPVEWFMRDSIHANARGKQAVGSILARYLAFTNAS